MDKRRLGDILKVAGAFVAAIATLTPFLPAQWTGPLTQSLAAVSSLIAAISGYAAGLGTRAPGTEYQAIADAKARASMMPPPGA